MLGYEIRKYLDENGIKYIFVANAIGVPKAAFTAMLNGTRKISAEEYFEVCKVLSVDMNFFWERLTKAS